jgi:hypothetical protein
MALLGYEIWQWLWVALQILAIFSCIRWTLRAGVNFNVACFTAALFWWIWLGHAMAGQCTLFILVAILWAVPLEENQPISPVRGMAMTVLLSSKVFNVFSLLGEMKSLLKPKPILMTLGALVALDAFVMGILHFRGGSVSVLELHQQWIQAGTSGGAIFSAETIRGNGNHGLTALILRMMRVPAQDSSKDIWVAGTLGIILSVIWYLASQKLPRPDRWVGWIAVGTVIHPLLWHHSFVLCYPVCALALDRAIRSQRKILIFSAFLSIALIGILIPNLFGVDFVRPIELFASKSWGAVLSCAVLALSPLGAVSDSVIPFRRSAVNVDVR